MGHPAHLLKPQDSGLNRQANRNQRNFATTNDEQISRWVK